MPTSTLRVGLIGHAFMGAVHSHAWRSAGRFFDLPPIELTAICGRSPDGVRAAAEKFGWRCYETDWRDLVAREDIDIVDICTPGDSHAAIAVAALQEGKHVLCEKPLANTVAEATAMVAAAQKATGFAMTAFNYRRVPALALARQLVEAGRLGELRQVRAQYLQDWLVDPEFPLTWRLRAEHAGSGALGDLGAHVIDLSQFLTGQRITSVGALVHTFVTERPLPDSPAERGPVTVDDAALFTARFDGGLIGSFEATRFAAGRKNSMRIEINGSAGSLAFDFEAMNELSFYDGREDPATAGFRRILATEPVHPYLDAWWPPGHGLGYEHTFTHQVRDFVTAIAEGVQPRPSFADGCQVQRVLAAVQSSGQANGTHIPVPD
ncbi:MAG TPA: Gfo/Idh/MocA family oxidoreductase [Pseudonocardiaceae bacterium]|jgi:predicted dehydrogenase|nr:Gfo/Idh/MocA family oxidoreductase [Pseudonocardiaceae bacterium]